MHIGFATQNPTSHYWLVVSYGARDRAAQLGVDIALLWAKTVEQQTAAIHSFVDQRVDAIIVGPIVARGLAGAIERARAARIPVIVAAAQVTDTDVTATVRTDHTSGAELAAAHMVERLGGVGEIAHIIGPTMLQDNIDRATGVRRVIGQHPGMQIAFEQESPDWRPASGRAIMRAALERHPNLRGVCAATDLLAIGAAEAVAAAGLAGQIVITGFDGSPEALLAINAGTLSASVRQSVHTIGATAVDLARQAALGQRVPPLVFTDMALVTRANLLESALESVSLMPSVLQDVVERGEALAQAHDEIIEAQRATLRELSTPLIPITSSVMIMPLIGSIDSLRARQVIETLLEGIVTNAARLVILDITGVPLVDTQVANTLIQAAQGVKLLGAEVVLTGIRPEVAQTLVGLGVSLAELVIHSTLQNGIAYALRQTQRTSHHTVGAEFAMIRPTR
ncbi:MAG TPA: substrate-binding domain-containing protein [Roseiflexaceae bacterium]|nr:substrate-binding domain-containing protein [Roseiflexaceae bacterium]